MTRRLLAVLIIVAAAVHALSAERYIVPVWGRSVRGATGTYTGVIAMTNTGAAETTVTVTKIVPMLDAPCGFPCATQQWFVPPRCAGRRSKSRATGSPDHR